MKPAEALPRLAAYYDVEPQRVLDSGPEWKLA